MNGSTSPSVERLSPAEIEARLRIRSVAYLPLGVLEFHGPHLPVGLDALTAHGLCCAAAERSGGVVLPVFYHAVGGEHSEYPWTIMSASPHAIQTLLQETLDRLADFGVESAVILSGHFPDAQQQLIDEVADRWRRDGAAGMSVTARTLGQVPDSPVPPDHAGRFESLVLHSLEPALVRPHLLPDPVSHPAPPQEDPFTSDRHRRGHPLHGVFGPDPRNLDVSSADALFDHLVSWIEGLADDGAGHAVDTETS